MLLRAVFARFTSFCYAYLKIFHLKDYDFSEDDVQKVVSLCVDGKESRIIFIDHKHVEMSVSKIKVYIYVPCFLSCNFIVPIIPQNSLYDKPIYTGECYSCVEVDKHKKLRIQ